MIQILLDLRIHSWIFLKKYTLNLYCSWLTYSLAVQHYLNAICQIPGLEGMRRDVLRDDEQVSETRKLL